VLYPSDEQTYDHQTSLFHSVRLLARVIILLMVTGVYNAQSTNILLLTLLTRRN